MVSDSQKKATRKYEKKAYDKILIRIRKDTEPTRATISQAATVCGMSLNEYIMQAIEEKMQRDEVHMAKAGRNAGQTTAQPLAQPLKKNPMEEVKPILRTSMYAAK